MSGPYFRYSDTWQLFINTGTTVVTFLVVFLILNTQNRETKIVARKLDELLRATVGASTAMIQLDQMSVSKLEAVQQAFARSRVQAATLIDVELAHVQGELETRRQ